MPWAQKDDGAWTDPTLAALTDRAFRLYDNCWTYAADKLTDGRITRDEVARVAAMFGLTDPDCLAQVITELVTWKLWIEDLNGYEIAGWLEQNRSKREVLETREGARQRMADYRARQAAKKATKRAKK